VGLKRGRPDPVRLRPGDPVDFFRVLEVQEGKLISLISEMKFPGEATLEFRLSSLPEGHTELQQLSRFLTKGISGLIYWYALHPFHQYVFKGMLRGIARSAGSRILEGPDSYVPSLPYVCRVGPTKNA
jgi:hypothetical protein